MTNIWQLAEECFAEITRRAGLDNDWMNPEDRDAYLLPIEAIIKKALDQAADDIKILNPKE